MSGPISFTPKHPQPFTLEQAQLLEVPILVAEIRRLQNSIAHLRETQAQLLSFLKEEGEGADEDGELRSAIKENDETIASQIERIALIKAALMNKLGKDALAHYGFDDPPTASPAANESATNQADTANEGLHL